VRTRVVDMANVTGAFYTNLMPENTLRLRILCRALKQK
jgi:hypothetical protein